MKLKSYIKESKQDWDLTISMKENMLRIAEKIEQYIDKNKKFIPNLKPFSKEQLSLKTKWSKFRALVKHPEYHELIPARIIKR